MKGRIGMLMTAVCLAVCMAVCSACGAAAEQTETITSEEEMYIPQRVSNETAEKEFLNGLFGLEVTPEDKLPRTRGTVSGDMLEAGSPERKLYDAMKRRMKQAAAGEITSTVFPIAPEEFDDHGYTAKELGVSSLVSDGAISADAVSALQAIEGQRIDRAMKAVFFDCPYEVFWKGLNCIYSFSFSYTGTLRAQLTVKVEVTGDYLTPGAADVYSLNAEKIRSMHTAAKNAQDIVKENATLGDYAKLAAYRDTICELTEYNHAAVSEHWDYGNPWQLVWVFDGDPETRVVCEGYSKAFQYLCDRSRWNRKVQVIHVTGTMDQENHMWNVVQIDGNNYLADVTNSDSGTAGAGGGLFLDRYTRKGTDNSTYYYLQGASETVYRYDEGTLGNFEAGNWLGMNDTAAWAAGADFWPSNATAAGEDLAFSVYPREDGPLYAAIMTADGTAAGTFTIGEGEETVIPGGLLTETGSYLLCLSRKADADMSDPNEAGRAVFHVCAERYAAPAVSILSDGETVGTDMLIEALLPAGVPDYYLETNITCPDGSTDYGFWDTPTYGNGRYTATAAGTWVETPGRYEIAVYAMADFPDISDTAPAKAPGIGRAERTLYTTALPAAPTLSLDPASGITAGGSFTVTAEGAEAIQYTISATEAGSGEEIWGTNPGNPKEGDSFTFSTDAEDESRIYVFYVRGKYNGLWSREATLSVPVTRNINPPADWAAVVPESLVPGQDATVTHPAVEGAVSYNVGLFGYTGNCEYYAESMEPGDFVIPAAAFADGGDYNLGVGVSKGEYGDWCWADYSYTVRANEGDYPVTIVPEKDSYLTGEAVTFMLYEGDTEPAVLLDAEQVIIQEECYNTSFPPEVYPYWETLQVKDRPGNTVTVRLNGENTTHRIRAAVKKYGCWSEWSGIVEIEPEASGIEWELSQPGDDDEWVLHISGSGAAAGYAEAGDAPWWQATRGKRNIRIVIEEGVTCIGSHAFSGMGGTVRADFLEQYMPEIADDAFENTNAICRYYSEDESWTAGTEGLTGAWIYLPRYEEDAGRLPIAYGYGDGWTEAHWNIYSGTEYVMLSNAQAREITYKDRDLSLEAIPTEADAKVYTTGTVPWRAGIHFSGRMTIDAAGGADTLDGLTVSQPGAEVTVIRTKQAPVSRIQMSCGQLDYTGNVRTLLMYNTWTTDGGKSATINGNVGEMDFYNGQTGNEAYLGDLTVNGRIEQGYEYGNGTMNIPGIGTAVPMDSTVVKQFSLTRTAGDGLLIDSGELTLASGEYEPVSSIDIRDYRLEYQFIDDENDEWDRAELKLTPKAGGNAATVDILENNPAFSAADIIQGSDTEVFIGWWDPETPKSITLGSGSGDQGIDRLFTNASCGTINLNCPVNVLEVYQAPERQNTLTLNINSSVNIQAVFSLRGKQSLVTLGANGRLEGSRNEWQRALGGTRIFPAVTGACTLMEDGRLTIMSRKEGEWLGAILPGDTALGTAAGTDAEMEITETVDPLVPEEERALARLMGAGEEIGTVFGITVTGRVNGEEAGTEITELNSAVEIAVENVTGEEAYIARLHEENGEITATAVSEATDAVIIRFTSSLFSKYVMIRTGGTGSLTTLRLPEGLTRIEEQAFTGGSFQAVIIPDGCTYIGENAFRNCDELVYISYPAGITIEENAFDNWDALIKDER